MDGNDVRGTVSSRVPAGCRLGFRAPPDAVSRQRLITTMWPPAPSARTSCASAAGRAAGGVRWRRRGTGKLPTCSFPSLVGADILIGGPPCQGFSRLGQARIERLNPQREGADPRNAALQRFLDAIAFWRPRAVVMENVPGMLSVRGVNVATEAGADIVALGLSCRIRGPQRRVVRRSQFRERAFAIGIRGDLEVSPSGNAGARATQRAELPSGYLRPTRDDQVPTSLPCPCVLVRETGRGCSTSDDGLGGHRGTARTHRPLVRGWLAPRRFPSRGLTIAGPGPVRPTRA